MKAFRNIGGSVVEIEVDVDPAGAPILPPDTTTDAKPEAQPGHYVTVVGKAWVQIPETVPFVAFETKKQAVLAKWKAYREWYVNSMIEFSGRPFNADEIARGRLSQAITVSNFSGYVPPAWIDGNNQEFPIASINDLQALAGAVLAAFSSRFYEMNTLRAQILAAADDAALDLIVIPTIPGSMF